MHFNASSHRFRDTKVENVWPWKFRSTSQRTTFTIVSFNSEYQSLLKMINEHYSQGPTVFQILAISTEVTLKSRLMSWYTTLTMAHSMANTWLSYLMAIVMFAPVLTIYEIIAKQIKCKKFCLEKDSQGQGVEKCDLCQLTANVWFYIAACFRILATWPNTFTQKDLQTHGKRQRCWLKANSTKQIWFCYGKHCYCHQIWSRIQAFEWHI